MLYFNELSDNVVFSCNEMGILNINLNNFNLDNNFDENDPDTIFLSDFSLGILYLKKTKHIKKELNEELMPVAWHPKRWWNFCMWKDEKKETEPIFIKGL